MPDTASQTQSDATTSFLAHFTSSLIGGSVHPALESRDDEITGLSMFSKSPIAADERLITCPASWVITPEISRTAIGQFLGEDIKGKGKEVDDGMQEWKETMLICGYICLHWIHHGRGGLPEVLQHWPYIASLPPAATLRTPHQFTESEMALLEGTNLHGATLDRQRQWRAEYEIVRGIIKDEGMTWERYLTAASYISSRAFPSKLLSMSEAGRDTETNAVQTSEEEESHPVLIPGMDIFNHSRGQPITWLTSSDPRTISLVAPSPIESGVQVFNNYGPKPNEELLLGYGFVLSPNPDDVLPLRLGGLGSNVSESKKARLTSKGLDAGKRWIIKRDGEIPRDLMEVLRIVMGDEQSHQHGHDHEHDDDDDEEEEEHGHWEQEMELELDVLGALGQMLDDKLAKLENVDTSIEAREDVRTMCGVYRQGQVDILTKAMEVIEERIERVERLTAEGEGCPCCN